MPSLDHFCLDYVLTICLNNRCYLVACWRCCRMSLAAPPLQQRSRASSTNVRPALTINTLGRRRSSSLVLPTSSEPSSPAISTTPSVYAYHPPPRRQPSMFALIVSKCFEFLHVPKQHFVGSLFASYPDSSGDDEPVLPLSASSQKVTFGVILNEKQSSKSHRLWHRSPAVSPFPSSCRVRSRWIRLLDRCTLPYYLSSSCFRCPQRWSSCPFTPFPSRLPGHALYLTLQSSIRSCRDIRRADLVLLHTSLECCL